MITTSNNIDSFHIHEMVILLQQKLTISVGPFVAEVAYARLGAAGIEAYDNLLSRPRRRMSWKMFQPRKPWAMWRPPPVVSLFMNHVNYSDIIYILYILYI